MKDFKPYLWFLIFLFISIALILGAFQLPYRINFYGTSAESTQKSSVVLDEANTIDRNLKISEYETFYFCLSIAISVFLLWIAYYNLRKIAEESEANFLLQIAKLWREKDTNEAKEIIGKLVKNHRKLDGSPDIETVGYLICKILKYEHVEEFKYKDSIRLANKLFLLLDFWETVGYFEHINYVTTSDVLELCGGAIFGHYNIFKYYIKEERIKDDKRYQWFCNLGLKIKQIIEPDKKTSLMVKYCNKNPIYIKMCLFLGGFNLTILIFFIFYFSSLAF